MNSSKRDIRFEPPTETDVKRVPIRKKNKKPRKKGKFLREKKKKRRKKVTCYRISTDKSWKTYKTRIKVKIKTPWPRGSCRVKFPNNRRRTRDK